jgi:hypothetical protein
VRGCPQAARAGRGYEPRGAGVNEDAEAYEEAHARLRCSDIWSSLGCDAST